MLCKKKQPLENAPIMKAIKPDQKVQAIGKIHKSATYVRLPAAECTRTVSNKVVKTISE